MQLCRQKYQLMWKKYAVPISLYFENHALLNGNSFKPPQI